MSNSLNLQLKNTQSEKKLFFGAKNTISEQVRNKFIVKHLKQNCYNQREAFIKIDGPNIYMVHNKNLQQSIHYDNQFQRSEIIKELDINNYRSMESKSKKNISEEKYFPSLINQNSNQCLIRNNSQQFIQKFPALKINPNLNLNDNHNNRQSSNLILADEIDSTQPYDPTPHHKQVKGSKVKGNLAKSYQKGIKLSIMKGSNWDQKNIIELQNIIKILQPSQIENNILSIDEYSAKHGLFKMHTIYKPFEGDGLVNGCNNNKQKIKQNKDPNIQQSLIVNNAIELLQEQKNKSYLELEKDLNQHLEKMRLD